MKIRLIALLVLILAIISNCSTITNLNRTYNFTMDEIYSACLKTINDRSGQIIFQNKGEASSMISYREQWNILTLQANEITVTIIKGINGIVNVIMDVKNPSMQLIDYKSKEQALSNFDQQLMQNLSQMQSGNY